MKFVKVRTSNNYAFQQNGSEELVEINNLDELLQIQKDKVYRRFDLEIIIGQHTGWRNLYPIERRKLYEEADGWYIEIKEWLVHYP